MTSPRDAPGRVLSTLNEDGSRRLLRPVLSPGGFWRRRRVVAWALMALFFLIPYLRMGGKPLVLLDIPRREFTILGATFLPTDTLLFMLLFLSVGIAIFLATALFGRIWCGWGCPQTVYMEFLFRPIEHLIEGGPRGTLALDQQSGLKPRRLLKYAIFLGLSLFLAHTFLAYFVGIDRLVQWVQLSPAEHPTAFLVMAGTTLAIYCDFAWFREQTCLVACPYGRLQSVLLDRKSLIVGYDPRRGEPRARGSARTDTAGDCVDCGACVRTCPTGIDIRDGLQMECIHCTQCMDACDEIMDKVGKPRGLVRYSSRDELEGGRAGWLRPRVVLYPAALVLTLGAFTWNLATRSDADVTLLRGLGAPYALDADGQVVNQVRIKITNRTDEVRSYTITLAGADQARLVLPGSFADVPPGEVRTASAFVMLPPDAFASGERRVVFRVDDGREFGANLSYRLVGPRPGGSTVR